MIYTLPLWQWPESTPAVPQQPLSHDQHEPPADPLLALLELEERLARLQALLED